MTVSSAAQKAVLGQGSSDSRADNWVGSSRGTGWGVGRDAVKRVELFLTNSQLGVLVEGNVLARAPESLCLS